MHAFFFTWLVFIELIDFLSSSKDDQLQLNKCHYKLRELNIWDWFHSITTVILIVGQMIPVVLMKAFPIRSTASLDMTLVVFGKASLFSGVTSSSQLISSASYSKSPISSKKPWFSHWEIVSQEHDLGSSRCGSVETDPPSIHEDEGSIPGPARWVKDLVLLWTVM